MPESITSVTTYTAQKMRDIFAMVVNHADDPNVDRPEGITLVIWKGTVVPANMAVGDLFVDLS